MATLMMTRRTSGARPQTVEVELLARDSGLHPDVVRRLVRLGAVDPPFTLGAAARLSQVTRLRRDLGLNYAGAVLACDLLARIDELEARLRRYETPDHRPR
jgi:hypothetical protein